MVVLKWTANSWLVVQFVAWDSALCDIGKGFMGSKQIERESVLFLGIERLEIRMFETQDVLILENIT